MANRSSMLNYRSRIVCCIAIVVVAKEPEVEKPSNGETVDTDPMTDVDSKPAATVTVVGVASSEDVHPEISPRDGKSKAKKRPRGLRVGEDCNGGGCQHRETDMTALSDLGDGDAVMSAAKRSKVEGSGGGGGVESGGSGGVKLAHGSYDITVNGEEVEEGSSPGDVQVRACRSGTGP